MIPFLWLKPKLCMAGGCREGIVVLLLSFLICFVADRGQELNSKTDDGSVQRVDEAPNQLVILSVPPAILALNLVFFQSGWCIMYDVPS
jgi:hypothetical protein